MGTIWGVYSECLTSAGKRIQTRLRCALGETTAPTSTSNQLFDKTTKGEVLFEEKLAREAMFGYSQIFNFDAEVLELPNPHLLRLAKKGKKEKVNAILMDFQGAAGAALKRAESLSVTWPLPDGLVVGTIEYVMGHMKPEYRAEVNAQSEHLVRICSISFHLGRLDSNRIGEDPAVAAGIYRQALDIFRKRLTEGGGNGQRYESADAEFYDRISTESAKKDFGAVQAASENVARAAFYASRRFSLKI